MEAIIYLFQRTIINSIKELKKNPLKLISYIVLLVLMVAVLFLVPKVDSNLPKTNIGVYKSIFLVLILAYIFLSIKNGIEKGNNLFRLSDSNFLFTAPMKPQLVLFYGFTKQIQANLLLVFILSIQIPNLYMNFSMKSYGWAIVLMTTFVFSLFASILGVLVYSIGSIRESYKKVINYVLYGITGLFALGLVYSVVKSDAPLYGAIGFLNMKFFNYIPIVGWIINIYTSAILGFDFMTTVYIGLTILSAFVFLFVIYNLNLDYYEDALNNSLTKEEQLAKAKSGKTGWGQANSKTRKIRGKVNYTGGKTIFSKQILESRKTGSIFVNKSTLFAPAFSLIYGYIMRDKGINMLLYMLVYMDIILSQSSQWSMELEKHYIYLIPDSSTKKIIYATILENIRSLITGLIIFGLSSFIYDINLIQGLILGITYASFTAIILYSDLVMRRILGSRLSIVAERLVRFLMIGVLIVPGLILSFALGLLINKYTSGYGSYLIIIGYNILLSLLFISLSKGIFEKLDMR